MAILIDPPAWPAHGTLWSHLVSDADYDELHAFAARLRVPRRGFDLDHYDVPAAVYEQAVALGALPVSAKEVVHRLRGAGLRVRQVDRTAVTPVRRRQYLEGEWAGLGAGLGVAEAGALAASGTIPNPGPGPSSNLNPGPNRDRPATAWSDLGGSLLRRWNEPHRSYHDERHLEDVLFALNHLAVRGERVSPATLLAAWFHDAVYTGSSGSDELDSAQLAVDALSSLGLDPELVSRVGGFIVDTTPAREVLDAPPPLAHLLDADLAIFASSPHRYEQYAAAVRAEYAHVPAAEFAAGRAGILSGYLDRPAIYRTATARQLWEDRARANLTREIATLLHTNG
ncbi:MAG: DUF4031 domain-containing protein [Leucobacter sp.]